MKVEDQIFKSYSKKSIAIIVLYIKYYNSEIENTTKKILLNFKGEKTWTENRTLIL